MRPIVVVKVGGSLLDWAGLPERLRAFLDGRSGEQIVLVCGGGDLVEAIRTLGRVHGLGEEASHALALSAMDVSAEALARIVPGLERVGDVDSIPASWGRGMIPVLSPRKFLDDDGRSADPLPRDWSATSDSIAARLAERLGASALILLKSASIADSVGRLDAARLGVVDEAFPGTSRRLEAVLYVDFRAEAIRPRRFE